MFKNRRRRSEDREDSRPWGLLLVLLSLIPVLSHSEFRDPTQPSTPKIELPSAPKATDDNKLRLSAIWISSKSRHATINGILVKQGQTILTGIKIIKIKSNSVDLIQNDKPKTLELLQRPYTLHQ